MAVGQPNMKILVVDDFPTMRRIIKTLLRQNGFTNIVEAENGVQAIQVLQEQTDIEFVISDWNMPEMDGLEFIKAVRREARYSGMVILMVTTETETDQMLRALTAGADEYLMKPFQKESLVDKLRLIGIVK